MKKLLAIAVAAAITVPMAAMADTTVYGKGHVSIGKTKDVSGMFVKSHSSRIGLKGLNSLDNGLTATHKFEIGYDVTDKSALSLRDGWVGLKGGFGEFRIGRQTTPYSIVDDAAAFTTRNDHGLHTFARANNALAYINKFGSVGVALAYVAAGEAETEDPADGSDSITNLLVNYSAGPIYAGVAMQDMPTGKTGSKLALAYKGANYGVGINYEKLSSASNENKYPGLGGDKVFTVAGKYSFGKAYVAAQYGKNKDSDLKQKTIELGYGLGKGTKVYYEWESIDNDSYNAGTKTITNEKTNRIGLVHSF